MQDIIVIVIGVVVFGYVAYKTYKTLTKKASPNQKCAGCDGCSLKVDVHNCTSDKKSQHLIKKEKTN